jgi:hypothetical protein
MPLLLQRVLACPGCFRQQTLWLSKIELALLPMDRLSLPQATKTAILDK